MSMTNKSTQVEVKKSGNGHPVPAQHPFRSLRDQVDRLMDEFDRGLFPSRWLEMTPFSKLTSEIRGLVPAMDVIDEEKAYRVTAELPGLADKDIEVTKDGDLLTIKGEKKEEHEEKEKGYFLSERNYGSIKRSLRLPDGIDGSKIEAKFENGVLTVILPKTPEAVSKPKKIEIKAA
jgi:HSP20 family protein